MTYICERYSGNYPYANREQFDAKGDDTQIIIVESEFVLDELSLREVIVFTGKDFRAGDFNLKCARCGFLSYKTNSVCHICGRVFDNLPMCKLRNK